MSLLLYQFLFQFLSIKAYSTSFLPNTSQEFCINIFLKSQMKNLNDINVTEFTSNIVADCCP